MAVQKGHKLSKRKAKRSLRILLVTSLQLEGEESLGWGAGARGGRIGWERPGKSLVQAFLCKYTESLARTKEGCKEQER